MFDASHSWGDQQDEYWYKRKEFRSSKNPVAPSSGWVGAWHDTLIHTLRYLTGTCYMTWCLMYYKGFVISYKMQPWQQIHMSLEVTLPTQQTTHKRELNGMMLYRQDPWLWRREGLVCLVCDEMCQPPSHRSGPTDLISHDSWNGLTHGYKNLKGVPTHFIFSLRLENQLYGHMIITVHSSRLMPLAIIFCLKQC